MEEEGPSQAQQQPLLLAYIVQGSLANLQAVLFRLPNAPACLAAATPDASGVLRRPIRCGIDAALQDTAVHTKREAAARASIAVAVAAAYGANRGLPPVIDTTRASVAGTPLHAEGESVLHYALRWSKFLRSTAPTDAKTKLRRLYSLVRRLMHEAGASAALPNVAELAVVGGLYEVLPRLLSGGAVFRTGARALPCLPMLFLNDAVPMERVMLTLERLIKGGVQPPRHSLRLDATNPLTNSTALHSAAFMHQPQLVAALLALGANPLAEDNRGDTPLAIVRGLLRGRRKTPVTRAELLHFETALHRLQGVVDAPLPSAIMMAGVAAPTGRRCDSVNAHWRAEAIAVETLMLRALELRDCELTVMMAAHPRLGAGTLLHRVETTLLAGIARSACVFVGGAAPASSSSSSSSARRAMVVVAAALNSH